MATIAMVALELCIKLTCTNAGLLEISNLAKALLEDSRTFLDSQPSRNNPDSMVNLYLLSPTRSFQRPYGSTSGNLRSVMIDDPVESAH